MSDSKNYCDLLEEELGDIKKAIQKVACVIRDKDCQLTCTCEGGGGGTTPTLCIATGTIDVQATGTALVDIPPNACVTKIYATFRPGVEINTFADVLILPNAVNAPAIFFQTFFENNPGRGAFETTLVQPLCVGPDGAIGRVTAEVQTTVVSITVIYCPNCCAPVPE